MGQKYYLTAYDPITAFEIREVTLVENVRCFNKSDQFWAHVNPPMAFSELGERSEILLAPRHVGYPIIRPKEWPIHVYVSISLSKQPIGKPEIEDDDFKMCSWGLLFQSPREARDYLRKNTPKPNPRGIWARPKGTPSMNRDEILRIIDQAAREGTSTLDLSDKGIESLPSEIGQLTYLRNLILSNNRLTSLPEEIGQLTYRQNIYTYGLERLYLDGNRISSLPPEIFQLTTLQVLVLSENQLTSLPKEVGKLTNLQSLSLRDNQLTSLPAEIDRLTALQELELSENLFSSLPSEICKLTCLEVLDLADNQLTSLPVKFSELYNLHSLYLYGNPLTSPPIKVADEGIDAICDWLCRR